MMKAAAAAVLTGFIRVVVIGALVFLRWGRLLAGRRSTEGRRLPPLLSPSSRSHLFWRSCSRRVKSCKHIQSCEAAEEPVPSCSSALLTLLGHGA